MYEIFAKLLQERGITAYRVSMDTGVPQSTLSGWKQGLSRPKYESMRKIADYFGVTVDYLTGKSEEKKKSVLPEENGLDEEFIRSYSRLNETNRAQIDSLIQFLLSRQGQ